ncbi:uncharacterized protein [Coffea arabica]|uniref:DUF4283 domain-containing protein n=1 Tax=Coffea arabica TaxID=13443 RepID=A0ABM4VUN0_COFAR
MPVSKWTLEFRVNQGVFIAPVWANFPDLPLPFFHKSQLSKLASMLGRLLRIDRATCDLRRPSAAQLGHEEGDYFKKNPSLRPSQVPRAIAPSAAVGTSKGRTIYIPKHQGVREEQPPHQPTTERGDTADNVEKSLQGQWREMPPASMAVEEKERGLVEPVHLDNKFAALTFMEENDDLTGVFAQHCQSFIDNDYPRSALLDEVDKELLSGLNLDSQGVEKVARKKICVDNAILLVILLEPMSDISKVEVVRCQLCLDHGSSFFNSKSGSVLYLSAVYAKCSRVGRLPLWKALEDLTMGMLDSWIVTGDFDMVLIAKERCEDSLVNVTNMEEVNSFMFTCGLSTVNFDGSLFTWTNGSIWQRLDRELVNSTWASAYALTKVFHLHRGRSDHSPLLIQVGKASSLVPDLRYLNIWYKHLSFMDLVSTAWRDSVSGVGMAYFYLKLVATRAKLRIWSKQVFENILFQVKMAKDLYK